MPRSSTWVSRIDAYFTDDKNQELNQDYQQQQALVAIYNGGFQEKDRVKVHSETCCLIHLLILFLP